MRSLWNLSYQALGRNAPVTSYSFLAMLTRRFEQTLHRSRGQLGLTQPFLFQCDRGQYYYCGGLVCSGLPHHWDKSAS